MKIILIFAGVISTIVASNEDLFASWFAEQKEEVLDDKLLLEVDGIIPSYIEGRLIRAGPSILQTKDKNFTNFLDAFGRVTAWTLSGKSNDAWFQSAIIKSILWNHSISDDTISPHISQEKTSPSTKPGLFDLDDMDNTDVNVYRFPGSNSFLSFTDFYLANEIDLTSLRALGSVQYKDNENFPKNAFFSSSHPCEYIHPTSQEIFLINWVGVKTAKGSSIYIYALDSQMTRTAVGRVDIGYLPYSIHSVALVGENVVVVASPVSIDFVKSGVTLCLTCSINDLLSTDSTMIYVFSLTQPMAELAEGATVNIASPVAIAEVEPPQGFFLFHHINAWLKDEVNSRIDRNYKFLISLLGLCSCAGYVCI